MSDQLKKRLLEDVVIFTGKQEARTGAEALAPDHSPRERYRVRALPERGVLRQDAALQQQVEEFLFHQAELLDTKNWQAYIELFAEQGIYWMPARPEQTEWLDSPSIFAEDRPLMTVRMERITHPNAWSQAPLWETSHIVGNVVIEETAPAAIRVRSRFQVQELRRDSVRSFAGSYRHNLLRRGDDFRIELQRVDLMNAQAPFDYTIQAWV
jgi:3-phenylpropionate/cinnamic acid dioxygenase small subunit